MRATEPRTETMHSEILDAVIQETETQSFADNSAIAALNKSEIEAQLDAAHRYPRSIKRFLNDAITMATLNQDIAEACMYALPRDGKTIEGPSVRLAEICASAYGNMQIAARSLGAEETQAIGQGMAWDIEKNVRFTVEARRRITTSKGKRYSDDMIIVTSNAAASVGLRNAIFRVIPKTYVDLVYQRAREVAVGNASTLSARRATVFERLVKMGALQERVLARINRASVEDVTLDDVAVLIGLGTAIKNGDAQVDDLFPAGGTPTRGTVDIDSLKPGREENRGHGNENLGGISEEKKNSGTDVRDKLPATASARSAEVPPASGVASAPRTESAAGPTQLSQEAPGGGSSTPHGSTPAPPAAADPEKKWAPVTANDLNIGPIDPDRVCTDKQFETLQTAQLHNDVEAKVFIAWIRQSLGYKMTSHMKQKDYARALKFLQNGGKE